MSWCCRPTWWRLTTLCCPSRACRRDVKVARSLLPLLPRLPACWSRSSQGTSVFFHRWLICWCSEMSMSVQLSCFIVLFFCFSCFILCVFCIKWLGIRKSTHHGWLGIRKSIISLYIMNFALYEWLLFRTITVVNLLFQLQCFLYIGSVWTCALFHYYSVQIYTQLNLCFMFV